MFILSLTEQKDFLTEQKKYERVRAAISEKHEYIRNILEKNNLSTENLHVLFIAYKECDELEVYAKTKSSNVYKKIISYPVCARSGHLGPKRKQGDGQVPEGFYYIDKFNPVSSFYLSLGINFPNLADRRKSQNSNLGGDIFIHGSCVTIGCLPMTDNNIKEIYLLALYARNNGQMKIPVYIFPFRMTDENMETFRKRYKNNEELLSFWDNLKIGYDKFFREYKALNIIVSENGDYLY
jgi:murein L,D-transpeptidase YafK